MPEIPFPSLTARRVFITGGSGFIGTNLIESLLEQGCEVCNYDPQPPLQPAHRPHHQVGDILDASSLRQSVAAFQPDNLIHLAARTDCDETTTVKDGYRANTDGTQNVLDAIKATPGIQRALITSSQYVAGPGRLPKGDEDYFPHTVYGWSKVETERLTRAADLPCTWTLIRPVNIWGPWHQRYTREFWKIVHKGLYLHPGVPSPTRAYGYVGNIVWQIMRILELPPTMVNKQVFYVGDRPISIDKWIYAFHREIRGRDPLKIPFPAIKALAVAGDGISRLTGKPFYITSSRLRSMTQDYLTDIEPTFTTLGEPPFSLGEGVKQTTDWLRQEVWK